MATSGTQPEKWTGEYKQVAFDQSIDLIEQHLRPFSREIVPGSSSAGFPLRHLAYQLKELSNELKAIQTVFDYHAEKSSRELAEFLESAAYQALFVKGQLATKPTYLQEHLGSHIKALFTQGIEQRNYEIVFNEMRDLSLAVSDLSLLKDNWDEFRKALAKGLVDAETEAGKRLLEAFDELSHSIIREIVAGQRKLIWNQWPVALSHLRLAERLAEWLKGLFENVGWGSFVTICSTSASAIPMVTLLGTKMDVEWIACDNKTLNFTREPRKNERILLLDTALQTGAHYIQVSRKVEAITGIPVVGCFCLVHNDMLPLDKEKGAVKPGEIPNLIYLYEISGLVEAWENSGSLAVQEAVTTTGVSTRQEAFAKMREQKEAFIRMKPMLMKEYPGQYVAVHGGEVVDSDVDEAELIRRFYQKYGASSPVYIDIVVERKPTIVMPSPYSVTKEG